MWAHLFCTPDADSSELIVQAGPQHVEFGVSLPWHPFPHAAPHVALVPGVAGDGGEVAASPPLVQGRDLDACDVGGFTGGDVHATQGNSQVGVEGSAGRVMRSGPVQVRVSTGQT